MLAKKSIIRKKDHTNKIIKEEPSLSQYGLENTDIDQLKQEYGQFVDCEKGRQKKKELKVHLGFVVILFTWVAPLMGVFYLLNLFFKWNTSVDFLVWGAVYVIGGTIFLFVWGKWAEDADNSKSGIYSLNSFSRKEDWNNYLRYKDDSIAYSEWRKRCEELFWENLSGLQFEEEVAKLYSGLGYKTRKTRASNDGGVDVILYRGKEKVAIQCKAYNKKIPPSVARELYGVITANDFTSGIIATINGASDETLVFCKKCKDKPITILDVNDLIDMQTKINKLV